MKLAIFTLPLALAAFANPTLSQQHSFLLREGDVVGGIGTITYFGNLAMTNDGTYYVRVNGEAGATLHPHVVLKDGAIFLEPGQALGNGPAAYSTSGPMDTDTLGNLLIAPEVLWPGASQDLPGIVLNEDLVMRPYTPVGIPGTLPNTTYDYVSSTQSLKPGELLMSASLDIPTSPGYSRALVELKVDGNGNVYSEELVYQNHDLFPGTTETISRTPSSQSQYGGNAMGDVVCSLRLRETTGVYRQVITLNGEIALGSGEPSGIPGHTWFVPHDGTVDINEAGDWVAHASIDDGQSKTGCIVKNGEVLYMDGQVFPDTAPDGIDTRGSATYLKLTDEGDVIWRASWGAGGVQQNGLFFNESLVLGYGTPMGTDTFRAWSHLGFSPDGSRLGASIYLEATPSQPVQRALIEVRFDLASTFCTAVPNSTGRAANTAVMGSLVAADNDITLRATNLPVGSNIHFFTSPVQTFVANPGGSEGNLCLGGAVGRYAGQGQILQAGASGRVELEVDLFQHPTALGSVVVRAGETWLFQAWYRDSSQGQPVSNFTDAAGVAFE